MRAVVLLTVTPLLLLASLAGAGGLLHAGWSPPIVVAFVNAAVALIIAALERHLPHRPEWNRSHDDVKTDLLHMLFAMIPVPIVFRALTLGGLTAASVFLATQLGDSLWPSQWPLAVQLLLALVVGELGQYWVHRLGHERAVLWRLHSVHHSVERLYWLNAGRFHPLDTLLQHGSEVAPLILLGADAQVLALYTVFTSANGLLRHANIEMRVGLLSWVLSTADLHRWHHSREVAESNANYGANLILWDVVFGTRRAPTSASPATLGLQAKDFPRTFLALLAAPFRGPRGEDG
jgi:sterol desaturase/sphingolipid hydroxylase (fatty acid hydroxylase superfamily)